MCCPECCTASASNRPVQITINECTDPDQVVAAIRKYIKRNGSAS